MTTTESRPRYLVIEVSCLECSEGEACPYLRLTTDDRELAVTTATNADRSSQSDMFVVDTLDGSFIEPNSHGPGSVLA